MNNILYIFDDNATVNVFNYDTIVCAENVNIVNLKCQTYKQINLYNKSNTNTILGVFVNNIIAPFDIPANAITQFVIVSDKLAYSSFKDSVGFSNTIPVNTRRAFYNTVTKSPYYRI